MTARAETITEQEKQGDYKIRHEILDLMMRYLDTDTLLCWAPAPSPQELKQLGSAKGTRESLRELQVRVARPIIIFLTTRLWPAAEIQVTETINTIIPKAQPQATKGIIREWIAKLPPYELVGLERAVLAGKGLLAAVRLLVEWSAELRHYRLDDDQHSSRLFGIDEAAEAASLEVRWQTELWGEVEDTHDVEKEDLRRQLGSVISLVAGRT